MNGFGLIFDDVDGTLDPPNKKTAKERAVLLCGLLPIFVRHFRVVF